MMENLNDDIQLLIINYLEFVSQFWLWVASKDVAPRIYGNELDKYGRHVEADFISIISPTVKHLELYLFSISNLECWREHSFPFMESLYYTVDYITHAEHKEALQLIVELFPKLKSLTTPSYIHGQIIEKLTDLEILDLSESFLYFIEFDSIDGILRLPKLRSFSFYTEPHETESIINEIFQRRGLDIRQLLASSLDYRFLVNKDQYLKNVRLLTLCSSYYVRDEFESLVSNMPALEELNLLDCAYWQTERDLWRTVVNCRSLKILGFSSAEFVEDFFHSSRWHMQHALNNHAHPLIFNCYQTDDDSSPPSEFQDMAYKYFNHSNLTFCLKRYKDIPICNYLTKIEFI